MLRNFYIKSDYNKMNIVWMMLIKIIFEYIIIKIDMTFILHYRIKRWAKSYGC